MTPRVYKLYLTGSQKLALFVPLAVLILMPIIFFSVFLAGAFGHVQGADRLPPFFPWFPFVFFFAFAGFFGYTLLSLPHQISVTAEKMIVFKSFLRTQSVRPTDVVSIEPKSLRIQTGISGYQLTHLNGKIRYPGQFTGMYLFLGELRQLNPSVEIRGC